MGEVRAWIYSVRITVKQGSSICPRFLNGDVMYNALLIVALRLLQRGQQE